MDILPALLSLFVLFAVTLAEEKNPVSELEGRVFVKNLKFQKYLVFDPLSTDASPMALLWNIPQAIPPRGGAWFHLVRSTNQNQVDYNLIGGTNWNYTLCVSMQQPKDEPHYHNVHGYIDESHLEAPECRWMIALSFDKQYYWIINTLYGGHLRAPVEKFNVDPLRRRVFLAIWPSYGDDEEEKWQIGRVLEPNDRETEDDS